MLEIDGGSIVKSILKTVLSNSSHAEPVLSAYEIKKPRCTVTNFLKNLQQQLELSEQIVIASLALLMRLSYKNFLITQKLLFKLVLVCLVLTQKMYSDIQYSLESFSLSSGVPINQIKNLEERIIDLLDFDLLITDREYLQIQKEKKEKIQELLISNQK